MEYFEVIKSNPQSTVDRQYHEIDDNLFKYEIEPIRVAYRIKSNGCYGWCNTFLLKGAKRSDIHSEKDVIKICSESIDKLKLECRNYQEVLVAEDGNSVSMDFAYDFVNGWWEITVETNSTPLF